jgi:hypothetical protein
MPPAIDRLQLRVSFLFSVPTAPPGLLPTLAENPGFSRNQGEIRRETDCLLEEDGFEPSVPLARCRLILGEEKGPAVDQIVSKDSVLFTGDQWFESVFIQRRVRNEPSAARQGRRTIWLLACGPASVADRSHTGGHPTSWIMVVAQTRLAFAPNAREPRLLVPRLSRRAVVMTDLHEAGRGDVIAPSVEIEEARIAVVAQTLLVIPARI